MYGFSAYSQVAYSTLPGGGGGTAFYGDVDETVTLDDAVDGLIIFGGIIAQTVRASSTQTASADFATSISETVNATDTVNAVANFVTSISEQSSFSSTEVGTIVVVGAFADSIQVTDTQSSVITTTLVIFEEINNLYDVVSCRADFAPSVSESITFTDSTTPTTFFVTSLAESCTFNGVSDVFSPAAALISETVRCTPTQEAIIGTELQVSEALTVQDANISAVTFVTNLVESAAFANAQDRQRIVFGLIDITVNMLDVVIYDDAFIGRVEEQISAADVAAALAIFNPSLNEALNASAQFITSSNLTLAIIEQVRVSSAVIGAGLWREVIDTAGGNWVTPEGGAPTPGGGWGASQGGETFPSGGWTPIDTVPN